jgi:hypothetical protein
MVLGKPPYSELGLFETLQAAWKRVHGGIKDFWKNFFCYG